MRRFAPIGEPPTDWGTSHGKRETVSAKLADKKSPMLPCERSHCPDRNRHSTNPVVRSRFSPKRERNASGGRSKSAHRRTRSVLRNGCFPGLSLESINECSVPDLQDWIGQRPNIHGSNVAFDLKSFCRRKIINLHVPKAVSLLGQVGTGRLAGNAPCQRIERERRLDDRTVNCYETGTVHQHQDYTRCRKSVKCPLSCRVVLPVVFSSRYHATAHRLARSRHLSGSPRHVSLVNVLDDNQGGA